MNLPKSKRWLQNRITQKEKSDENKAHISLIPFATTTKFGSPRFKYLGKRLRLFLEAANTNNKTVAM